MNTALTRRFNGWSGGGDRTAIEKANAFFMIGTGQSNWTSKELLHNVFRVMDGTKSSKHFPYMMQPRSRKRSNSCKLLCHAAWAESKMAALRFTAGCAHWRCLLRNKSVERAVSTAGRPTLLHWRYWSRFSQQFVSPIQLFSMVCVLGHRSPYCLPMRGPGILRLHREFQIYLVQNSV